MSVTAEFRQQVHGALRSGRTLTYDEQLAQALEAADLDELVRLRDQVRNASGQDEDQIEDQELPKTPDELHAHVRYVYGISIPRVSVCEDHDSPFDFFCDIVLFKSGDPNPFGIGNRGGSKSFLMALAHHVILRHTPDCEAATFAAIEPQARGVYAVFRRFLNIGLPKGRKETEGNPKISATDFLNGSRLSVFTATINTVNGPHPQIVHSDEVEIMNGEAWLESRNMAADRINPDGSRIPGRNIGTSTRKYKNGRVQKIWDDYLDRVKRGVKLIWRVRVWCLFEAAEEVPTCQLADEGERRARLKELKMDPCLKCECDQFEQGKWDDGSPRTLDQVCKGGFFRSRGFRSYSEVANLFLQNDRGTFEAQQLCREAETEGLYIRTFSRQRHGLSRFQVDPANGPIFTAADFGTTNNAAVLWVQVLLRPVSAISYGTGEPIVLPVGARVAFAEIYPQGKSDGELADMAKAKEKELGAKHRFVMRVRRRWADLQGAGGRREWAKRGMKTHKYSTREFNEHVKVVRELFDNDNHFVDVDSCPVFCDEIESWRQVDGRQVDEFNHVMSASRYVQQGIRDMELRGDLNWDDQGGSVEVDAEVASSPPAPMAATFRGNDSGPEPADEGWRAHLSGSPFAERSHR